MAVPTSALFRSLIRLDELRDDAARGGGFDTEVLVEKEIAQPVAALLAVGGFVMRELGGRGVQHGGLRKVAGATPHA
jgi:hypothetical protein